MVGVSRKNTGEAALLLKDLAHLIDGEDVDVVEEVEHEEELLPAEDEDDSVANENGEDVEDEVDINIHDDIEGDEDMEATPAQQDEDMVVPEPQPDEVLADPNINIEPGPHLDQEQLLLTHAVSLLMPLRTRVASF